MPGIITFQRTNSRILQIPFACTLRGLHLNQIERLHGMALGP